MTIQPSTTAYCDPDTANNSFNEANNDVSSLTNSSINNLTEETNEHKKKETVEEFKAFMSRMQEVRRKIVNALMNNHAIEDGWVDVLRKTYARLTNAHTINFTREMSSSTGEKFQVRVKDEIMGLRKDLTFLDSLISLKTMKPNSTFLDLVDQIDLSKILEEYHPVSASSFREEFARCIQFLRPYVESTKSEGRKPIFITDWDGTMKDYCTQYATNLQPIYSAVDMARFATSFTRLSAVLTAGPLRGPGILDLTSLPIDGPIMFSGSWGREWWLAGKRIVHDDGISIEGIDTLERFNDEMRDLLSKSEYSQFNLVGSGVQRKVDRLTLGVQTVCNQVHPEISLRYQEAVRERIHRVDPLKQSLYFDPSTELEVEVVVHSDGTVWNKANGVARVVETVQETLEPPGLVLICGDTLSDLPMVQHAAHKNPQGVMALFVTSKEELTRRVMEIVGEPERCCFVSCPDAIHATMAELLKEYRNNEIN